ncbi:hypothetical protein ACHAXT_007740 [Thalassiosira profunda]
MDDQPARQRATARPVDATMSPRAQDALYEAARRRWEAQRRRRRRAEKKLVTSLGEARRPSSSSQDMPLIFGDDSPGADQPGFDVVTELNDAPARSASSREEGVANPSDVPLSEQARGALESRGEPSFDVVAFEECIDVGGQQTIIVVAPSSADLGRPAPNAPIPRPNPTTSHPSRTAQHDGLAGNPDFSVVYEGRGEMPQSMHASGDEEYIGDVYSTSDKDKASAQPRAFTNTRTKLKGYWKGLQKPLYKKPSAGSEGTGVSTISSSDEVRAQAPSPAFGDSLQTLGVVEEEPPPIALGTCSTTRVDDLRWEDSASDGKLKGLFSGPIDDQFQPHGEGTLRVPQTKFLFHGRWVHGRLVTPLLNDDEMKNKESGKEDGYVLDCKDDRKYERKLSSLDSEGSSQRQEGPPTKSPSPVKKKSSKRPKQPKVKYAMGEVARTPRDMVILRSNDEAIDAASMLKKYDQAFLKRSNGLWSCAVLVDRGFQPTNAPAFRWYTKDEIDESEIELEEGMLFVINEDGATKIVKRKHWGKFIRCMQNGKKEKGKR